MKVTGNVTKSRPRRDVLPGKPSSFWLWLICFLTDAHQRHTCSDLSNVLFWDISWRNLDFLCFSFQDDLRKLLDSFCDQSTQMLSWREFALMWHCCSIQHVKADLIYLIHQRRFLFAFTEWQVLIITVYLTFTTSYLIKQFMTPLCSPEDCKAAQGYSL